MRRFPFLPNRSPHSEFAAGMRLFVEQARLCCGAARPAPFKQIGATRGWAGMQITYRRDIDGLRAVAVGGVVLYHAGWSAIPGGFVGVDIFFVISGYLISAGLFADAGTRGISITRFYERRIRRILPAYVAVIFAALVASLVLLLPSEVIDLAKSAVSATLFAANIHFWFGTGYFSGNPLSHPLLHLWSLAVEEQFYIVWPLCVMAIYSLRVQWRVAIVASGIVISLVAAEVMLGYSAKTSFYMAPLRAWELLLGAIVACRPTVSLPRLWMVHVLGAAAALLMIAPMLLLNEASRFPGLSAVAPCVGAALVILHDPRRPSFLSELLSARLPVYLGMISYSLYMWHWPILSFVWYAHGSLPQGLPAVVLVAVIVAVAALSWRFIEQPFRVRPAVAGRVDHASPPRMASGKTLAAGGAVILLLLVSTAAVVVFQGFPQRLPPKAARLDAEHLEPYETQNGCVFTENVPSDAGDRCFAVANHQAGIKVVLWGDSFAAQHIKTIEKRFSTPEQHVVSIVATGCSPLPDTTQYFGKGRADVRCTRMNAAIFGQLLKRTDVRTVIMSGRWSNLYGLAVPGNVFDPTSRYVTDAAHPGRSLLESLETTEASLDRTITALRHRGIAVVILREPPRFAQDVQPCVARALWHGRLIDNCAVSASLQTRFRAPINAMLTRIQARHPDILVYDPSTILCHSGVCPGYANGILLTRDSEHLTRIGSELSLTGLSLNR